MSIDTLKDLQSHMCRWPVGDPQDKDFHFCGCRRQHGGSYCTRHNDMAYRKDSRARAVKKEVPA